MSQVFSDTITGRGLIQKCERNCGMRRGDISNNTTLLQDFTASINDGLDDITPVIIEAGGTWQWDDSNNTQDLPFIFTDLVSGQRDYSFLLDGRGNMILDIYRIMVRISPTGPYQEIYTIDQETPTNNNSVTTSFIDGLNASGIPSRCDLTGNSISLDLIPNYNATDGIKVFINREASYFTYTDISKKAGFAGVLHDYLALFASYEHARNHSLTNATKLKNDLNEKRLAVISYYGSREKVTSKGMRANVESTK